MIVPPRPLLLVTLISVAGATSSCSFIPPYNQPAAPVPAGFAGGSADGDRTPAAELPWRSVVLDPRPRRLIELALDHNRDFRLAVLAVERAQAQYRISRSEAVPHVSGDAGFRRAGSTDTTTSQWNASVGTTSYELDLFGRVRSLNTRALEEFFAAEENQRAAQITLVAEVAIQHFTVEQALEHVALARQTLAAVEASHALNQATHDAGATSELDLRTSEAQVETARINIITYQRQAALAENRLAELVGTAIPRGLPAARPLDGRGVLAAVPAGLRSSVLLDRPDILAAEHTLKAAEADIGAARAAFFPTITLSGTAGVSSTELRNLLGGGNGVWNFAPQLSVPIFDGGRNRATLDAAQVSARVEIATYEKAIQMAFREVADALATRESLSLQLEAQKALVKTQQRRYELADLRYRQGEELYLNVLSAQRDLYSAQQQLIQVTFDRLVNDVTLYKALGGGWH